MSSVEPALEISALANGGFKEFPADPARVHQLLSQLEAGEVIELSVRSPDKLVQYPIMHIDWHASAGFVVMVFESPESDGFYPIIGTSTCNPEIQIELGGQAIEKWPRELFVPRETAAAFFETFLKTGRQDSSFTWVANDVFAREIIWESSTSGENAAQCRGA